MDAANQFRVHCEISAFEKGNDKHPMRIGGIVSTDRMDLEDEKIIQRGLDFGDFLKRGWFNDNHGKGSTDVVGFPEGAKYVRKGTKLPNGKTAKRPGWWAEGYLLNTDKGRDLWQLAQSLQDTPRKLGFSIEGKVVERDETRAHVVKRANVRHVAITHCPVNVDTELEVLAKALTAGGSITGVANSPGGTPGDGAPLRTLQPEDDEDDEPIELADLQAPADSDEEVAKAVDEAFRLSFDSDEAYVDYWAPAVAAELGDNSDPDYLTKAEAEAFIAALRPELTPAARAVIIDRATGAL